MTTTNQKPSSVSKGCILVAAIMTLVMIIGSPKLPEVISRFIWGRVLSIPFKVPKLPELPQKIVKCPNCKGTGKVTYGPDHEIVIRKWAKPGTYECPMCGGDGELIEEIR